MANKWTTLPLRAKTTPEHRATNLQTAQEMIVAIRQVRAQQTLAAIRRVHADHTVEMERRKQSRILELNGLGAGLWLQEGVQEYVDQERASWDESEALPE